MAVMDATPQADETQRFIDELLRGQGLTPGERLAAAPAPRRELDASQMAQLVANDLPPAASDYPGLTPTRLPAPTTQSAPALPTGTVPIPPPADRPSSAAGGAVDPQLSELLNTIQRHATSRLERFETDNEQRKSTFERMVEAGTIGNLRRKDFVAIFPSLMQEHMQTKARRGDPIDELIDIARLRDSIGRQQVSREGLELDRDKLAENRRQFEVEAPYRAREQELAAQGLDVRADETAARKAENENRTRLLELEETVRPAEANARLLEAAARVADATAPGSGKDPYEIAGVEMRFAELLGRRLSALDKKTDPYESDFDTLSEADQSALLLEQKRLKDLLQSQIDSVQAKLRARPEATGPLRETYERSRSPASQLTPQQIDAYRRMAAEGNPKAQELLQSIGQEP